MAGNRMPVLTLDFNDEKVQKLQEIADKFKNALSIGPGGFPMPSGPISPMNPFPVAMPTAPSSPSSAKGGSKPMGKTEFEILREDMKKFMKEMDKETKGTDKTFKKINKTLANTTSTLEGLFKTTVTWGAKITAIGAGGGMFGYGYMTHHLTEQYKSPTALGITLGQQQAAHNVYGPRLSNVDSIMQSLAAAQNDTSHPMYAGLVNLNMDPRAGAAKNLPVLLDRVSSLLAQYKDSGVSQTILKAQGLDGLVDVSTANQILKYKEQIPGWNKDFQGQSSQLDSALGGDATVMKYQALEAQFLKNADSMGNTFLKAVADMSGPLGELSDNVTVSVNKFLHGPGGKALFTTIADGVKDFATWIGSKDFQDDLDSFSLAVKHLAEGTWSIIKFFGGSDEEQKKIIDETERKSSFALRPPPFKDAESRPNSTFLGGVEALGKTLFGVTTEAAKGIANDVMRHGSNFPRGLRNNNPGNLNFAGQPGAILENIPNGRFAHFQTMEEGIAALDRQLGLYISRGNDTIRGIVHQYAPEKDGNNESTYRAELSSLTGIGVNEHIDWRNHEKVRNLIRAIIVHENGYRGNSISSDQVDRAMDMNKNWHAPGALSRNARLQIDINQRPGSDIDAQVVGQSTSR